MVKFADWNDYECFINVQYLHMVYLHVKKLVTRIAHVKHLITRLYLYHDKWVNKDHLAFFITILEMRSVIRNIIK